ncbi:MAG: stage II sporulation protein M [Anaerolineae bacterium]|nr:stage II sporulation protein M [Anaerolineae bacterium]
MSLAVARVQMGWASFRRAWVVTQREVRDTMRDWRLVIPIGLLTLVFPALMQFTANVVQRWVLQYGGAIVGERIIPFLLMIVGFFPISFSLVIALETFVGEKERHSLEPLLATPLTNTELYWGKTMAAMIPPLISAYLGLAVYLTGLLISLGWTPSLELLSLIVLLTTAESLVMVSGAVVISSQTTSVRAANILASFVIIPMALLVQAESLIMFYADFPPLWWILAALIAADALLVRMGIRLFNREELLGREIDVLNVRKMWRTFLRFLVRAPEDASVATPAWGRFSVRRVYAHDLPVILRASVKPIAAVSLALAGAYLVGWAYAQRYPAPAGLVSLDIPEDAFQEIPDIGFLPSFNVGSILLHNLRALTLAAVAGVFSFGSLAIVLLMVPLAIIGFLAGQAPMLGGSALLLVGTFILPHGVVEMPAAIVATAMALRLGAVVVAPPAGMTVSQGLLYAAAELIKVMVFLVVPLLAVAAALEVWITPWVIGLFW